MTNPNIIITENMDTAGAVVWWRLSGTLTLGDLRAAWLAAGLEEDLLPSPITPVAAMRRTVQERCEKRRLARPLEGMHGWALVRERAVGEELEHVVECRVTLNGEDRLSVNPPTFAQAGDLRAAYERHLGCLSANDVSTWMCDLLKEVNGVSLRDTGGIYFIPRGGLAAWRAMMGVVRACSGHAVFEVPALRSDEAVEAILDAITREAETAAADMEEEIIMSDLGARALRTRANRCEAIQHKLEDYEQLLGRGMDTLKDRLGGLQAQLAAAALAATAVEP